MSNGSSHWIRWTDCFPARPTWRWRVGAVPMHSTTRTGPICGASPRPRDAGKPWVMPAWTAAERQFAREEGASLLVIATQTMTVRAGIASLIDAVRREGVAA